MKRVRQTKIEKLGLESLARSLFLDSPSLTEEGIADKLTLYCLEKEIKDPATQQPATFSQSSVNRFLKPVRREYRDKARQQLDAALDQHIKSDLEAVQEAIGFHFGQARVAEGTDLKDMPDPKLRSDMYMKGCRLVFDKVRLSLGELDPEEIAEKIARELSGNMDPLLQDEINGITQDTGFNEISVTH